MDWLNNDISGPDQDFFQKALQRQAQLTKPAGSLGVLENIAVRLAAMQETEFPVADKIWITVFAADHGIAEESVSAFPQSVTCEMLKNFADGGAAINVLANQFNAELEVVNVGTCQELLLPKVRHSPVAKGTRNFLRQPAMTGEQVEKALLVGKRAVARAIEDDSDLFVGGEMGIANTTSASACASAILKIDAALLTGAGTGLDNERISKKEKIIRQAVVKHRDDLNSPLAVLQCLGGFEIAALAGAFLFAAQQKLPVLIDGFIATVASLMAEKIKPGAIEWFFYTHCSAEKGHRLVLQHLKVEPLLNFNMRLGEASGAAVAIPVIRSACALHNQMATFEQAGISRK